MTGKLRVAASLLIMRIFRVSRWLRYSAITTIAFSILLALASILEVFLICKPFAAQWDSRILGACGDQLTSFILLESVGLVLDVAIFAVTTFGLWRVQISRRKRIKFILLLNFGAM